MHSHCCSCRQADTDGETERQKDRRWRLRETERHITVRVHPRTAVFFPGRDGGEGRDPPGCSSRRVPHPPRKKGLRQENWTFGQHRRVGTPAVASVSSAQYGRRESVFGELVRLSGNSIFGRKTLKIPGISGGRTPEIHPKSIIIIEIKWVCR